MPTSFSIQGRAEEEGKKKGTGEGEKLKERERGGHVSCRFQLIHLELIVSGNTGREGCITDEQRRIRSEAYYYFFLE